MNKTALIFDLDDTLYKEMDFLQSGYRAIAKKLAKDTDEEQHIYELLLTAYRSNENPFEKLIKGYGNATLDELLAIYRFHTPNLPIDIKIVETLKSFKGKGYLLGIITDGRGVTQRNKIKALGIEPYFEESNIVISEEFGSEKPSERNYRYFERLHPEVRDFVYVADNPKKDFVTPNALGWFTIGVRDDGRNIYKQSVDVSESYQPKMWIDNIEELLPGHEVEL